MPRLAAKKYLRTHDRLRKLWVHDHKVFAELPPMEQWQLHDFFKPDKDWSDLKMLRHRDQVTALRPSLPHQAGRALEKFWSLSATHAVKRVHAGKVPAGPRKRTPAQERKFRIKAIAQPEVDHAKVARAYINLLYAKTDRVLKARLTLEEAEAQDDSRARP